MISCLKIGNSLQSKFGCSATITFFGYMEEEAASPGSRIAWLRVQYSEYLYRIHIPSVQQPQRQDPWHYENLRMGTRVVGDVWAYCCVIGCFLFVLLLSNLMFAPTSPRMPTEQNIEVIYVEYIYIKHARTHTHTCKHTRMSFYRCSLSPSFSHTCL